MEKIEYFEFPTPPNMKVNLTKKEVLLIGEKFHNEVCYGKIHITELSAITYACLQTYLSSERMKKCHN